MELIAGQCHAVTWPVTRAAHEDTGHAIAMSLGFYSLGESENISLIVPLCSLQIGENTAEVNQGPLIKNSLLNAWHHANPDFIRDQ